MADPIPFDVLYIPQGAMFMHAWPLTDADTGDPADPTGWAARCEVRQSYGGPLITRFHSNVAKGWDGLITFDASANLVMTLDYTKTTALTPFKNAVFDVEITDPSGKPTRLVEGRAHITPEVTTDA